MENQTAKQILINSLNEYIESNEYAGVSQQQNAIYVRSRVLPKIEALNEMMACKVKKAIDEKEKYDPAADKWGFGPVKVSPCDFASFIPAN